MKTKLLALSALLASTPALAFELKLEVFDQFKLGELLGNLPTTVRSKVTTKLTTPVKGFEVRSVFPKRPGAFSIKCASSYFNGALYPSYTNCTVSISENSPEAPQQNDEFKITLRDAEVVRALYDAIPYSLEGKKFYSHGKEEGTTFDGSYSNVFHFKLTCQPAECVFTFINRQPQLNSETVL